MYVEDTKAAAIYEVSVLHQEYNNGMMPLSLQLCSLISTVELEIYNKNYWILEIWENLYKVFNASHVISL